MHSFEHSNFTGEGDFWFSLNGTTYQNNSCVALKDIGEGDIALHCVTNQTACCKQPGNGNWFFPNGTRVPSRERQWDFHRSREKMVVRLNRRRGGEDGIYRCEITDSMNVDETIYIGVYTASTGEWYVYVHLFCSTPLQCFQKSGSHIASLCIVNKVDYLAKYLKNVCV